MINTKLPTKKLRGILLKKRCIVCKEIFYSPLNNSKSRQRTEKLRSRRCKTCSSKCSKIFDRNKKKYKLKFPLYSTQKKKLSYQVKR